MKHREGFRRALDTLDMPVLLVNADRTASSRFATDRFTVADIVGKAMPAFMQSQLALEVRERVGPDGVSGSLGTSQQGSADEDGACAQRQRRRESRFRMTVSAGARTDSGGATSAAIASPDEDASSSGGGFSIGVMVSMAAAVSSA